MLKISDFEKHLMDEKPMDFSRLPTIPPDLPLVPLLPRRQAIAMYDLYDKSPCAILVLRRAGCPMCREWASFISSYRDVIKGYGINLMMIVKDEVGIQDFAQNYWKDDVYLDEESNFYKVVGDGDVKKANVVGMAMSHRFWSHMASSLWAGYSGNMKGEGFILGGMLIISSMGEIVYKFSEEMPGDTPPIQDILDNCASVQVKQEGEEAESSPVYIEMGSNRMRVV